jgi:S-adenosylmethionine:tRNA ribosyltransferase-isomerase
MPANMLRTDFHFDLPNHLIAQRPTEQRSDSRLLVLEGQTGVLRDLKFKDFPALLAPTDLLVFNDTRVIPARAFGVKQSGGQVEILLERVLSAHTALVHVRASKGLKLGAGLTLAGGVSAHMLNREGELYVLEFSAEVLPFFEAHGQMPLPPYIDRGAEPADRERYQTLYARELGAVAAPTAGLHFDRGVFEALAARQISQTFVTLHVGAGTFAPMRALNIDEHVMHAEYLQVPQAACDAINAAREAGGRIIAVGTMVVRSLESAAAQDAGGEPARLRPFQGMTRIFIKPGYRFRVVDALVTNFHLPESTLLMLCAAFVGRERLLNAYAHAVTAGYRFFSYGDAMFITPAVRDAV